MILNSVWIEILAYLWVVYQNPNKEYAEFEENPPVILKYLALASILSLTAKWTITGVGSPIAAAILPLSYPCGFLPVSTDYSQATQHKLES
jgi:hypothetical protein